MSERCGSSEHRRRSRRADAARSGNNRRRPRCSSKRRSPPCVAWPRHVLEFSSGIHCSQLALAAVNGYIKTSVPPSYVPTTPYYECYSASPAALRRCSSSPRPGCSCRRRRRHPGSPARRRRRVGRGCRPPSWLRRQEEHVFARGDREVARNLGVVRRRRNRGEPVAPLASGGRRRWRRRRGRLHVHRRQSRTQMPS